MFLQQYILSKILILAIFIKEEELEEHNIQVTPPGFHLIFLPFTDDLRRLKYEETPKGNYTTKEYIVQNPKPLPSIPRPHNQTLK